MKLLKADHNRRIEIPGVPGTVRRPVDIDRSRTGFENLRSLRIYQFDAGSSIDGHAEEDEVLVLVLAGSVEITVTGDNSGMDAHHFTLSAAGEAQGNDPCMVYLPPQSAYQLIPKTESAVAYARATPPDGPPSLAFTPQDSAEASGVTVLLQEKTYCRRLRLRLVRVNANQEELEFTPLHESEEMQEALVHLQIGPATLMSVGGDMMQLQSWDTAVIAPGDRPTLRLSKPCSATILVVSAI